MHVHREVREDAEIVGAAVPEDVVLQQPVARLRKGIQLRHLLLDAGVIGALRLHRLQELLHIIAQRLGILQTLAAVLQLLAREVERLVRLIVAHSLAQRTVRHRADGIRVDIPHRGLQRVDGIQHLDIALRERILIAALHRGHTLQRHDERVVALYLVAHTQHHLVVGKLAAALVVQLAIEVHGLLAGISHVKRVVHRL